MSHFDPVDPLKAREVVKNLRYEFYNPQEPTPDQKDLLDQLQHLRAFHPSEYVVAGSFSDFSLLNAEGWPRIDYASFRLPGGYLYWITDEHARKIGQALRPSLRALTLQITMPQGDGFSIMAQNVAGDFQLDNLTISHQSGDEVTVQEAVGLARLATRLNAQELHVWAAEFVEGALDALARELEAVGNRSLRAVDLCLTSDQEAKKFHHETLDRLAARNAGA